MAALLRLVILCIACACATAQYDEERAPRYIASSTKQVTTPVPILKQINRHNEDGSYTYGYEAADGSFKIETKSPTGEVKGKYGYKDDTGKLRVVEYGANKFGFQPAGEGITVAPPTLVDETTRDRPAKAQQGGRSEYRAQPVQQAVDYDYEEPAPAPPPRPAPRPQQYRPSPQQYRPAPQSQYQQPIQTGPVPRKPAFFAGAAPAPVEQNNGAFFSPAPEPAPRPRPKQDFRPAPQFQDFVQQPRYTNAEFVAPQQFPQPQPRHQQSFSMLDQLLKEYALPQGGATPTHDITFGSY
ncbi:mediator of RNA polymerase II transcription subunit 15-like [Hyposmocoma kahamanoa]|uniref:mediator of RNA polymerase II transcription subunit 15-like n=1 Tax=Hyposmocoma kahamanoa TaxID=1477025 RepID=UPI000E6D9BE9|nr:mediator of RNA polymerase II transcription subunit 15-like [Hyposmocoma kahamanoa]